MFCDCSTIFIARRLPLGKPECIRIVQLPRTIREWFSRCSVIGYTKSPRRDRVTWTMGGNPLGRLDPNKSTLLLSFPRRLLWRSLTPGLSHSEPRFPLTPAFQHSYFCSL